MRYVGGLVLALALVVSARAVSAQAGDEPPSSEATSVAIKNNAPPQLMLQAGHFYYVDVDPLGELRYASRPAPRVRLALVLPSVISPLSVGVQPAEEDSLSSWQLEGPETVTEEEQPPKRLSKRARIAVGVTVPIVAVGVGVGAGIGVGVSKSWSSSSSQ
jgi:hypothetical protein